MFERNELRFLCNIQVELLRKQWEPENLGGKIGLQIRFFRALKYIKRKHMSVMDNRRHSGLFKEK